ncbi:uncharacterized protein LOC115149571 [Tachysurus ichikawai]
MVAHRSETHFARSMRTTAVKYQELTKTQEFIAETKGTVAHRVLGLVEMGQHRSSLRTKSVEGAGAATVNQEGRKLP